MLLWSWLGLEFWFGISIPVLTCTWSSDLAYGRRYSNVCQCYVDCLNFMFFFVFVFDFVFDFDSDLVVFSILICVLVLIWIWDCELGFDFWCWLGIWMLLPWDSKFGIWVWSCALVSLLFVPGHLAINHSRNVRKTKQSGAVGGFGNELLYLSFLVDFFRSPRKPPIVFCFSFWLLI